jgi:hypothetical protein|tara:strand:+ start:20609 stop:21412 length:804 start_codon:yes stop_codon:yes gene_type:complete
MTDRNKSIDKLKGFPKVLWINLDRVPQRRAYMEEQLNYWGLSDNHRISGVDGDEYEEYLKGSVPHNMNKGEIACVMSHLNALRYFVEETDLNEIFIMEDDIDLSTVKHWTFTWKDVRKRLPINWDCLQLTIINPNGITLKLHQRFINDFSAAGYLITRHHATKVLRCHQRGNQWKLDQNIRPRAVSEDLILDSGKSYSTPLFNYRLDMGSAIHEEHIDIFHKGSNEALAQFWERDAREHTIDQIMELDEYCGRIPPSVYLEQAAQQQ